MVYGLTNNDQVNQRLFLYLIHKNSNFKFENKKLNLKKVTNFIFLKYKTKLLKFYLLDFQICFHQIMQLL